MTTPRRRIAINLGGGYVPGLNAVITEVVGIKTVCVPKSVENDMAATLLSFGFNSALSFATETLDRVRQATRPRARSGSSRCLGEHAGWLALQVAAKLGAEGVNGDYAPSQWGRTRVRRCGITFDGGPETGVLMFILQFGAWVIFSCILMSFVEHQVHRKLMHRKNVLSMHTASFKRVLEAHALVHHKHYTEIFSDEPVARGEDKEIRLTVRKAPIKAIPIAALIALVSWQGAATFAAVMVFHHWAWNKIHLEMHKPEQRVFSTWPVYTFLARYHCLHHRHVNGNFNVVFPLADYVLGTRVRANEGDLKYLEQWGL